MLPLPSVPPSQGSLGTAPTQPDPSQSGSSAGAQSKRKVGQALLEVAGTTAPAKQPRAVTKDQALENALALLDQLEARVRELEGILFDAVRLGQEDPRVVAGKAH